MTTINNLCQASTVSAGDLIPMYQQANGDIRSVSVGALSDAVNDIIQGEPDQTVYGLTMAGASFSMTVQPAQPGASVWALISINATAPNGTITLPGADSRANGQEVLVTCTQAVNVLTIVGLGAAVYGAPVALPVNGFFRLRYDSVSNAWYRIG